MNHLKKKIDAFNKRWDFVENLSHEEEFRKFKIRILNDFTRIDRFLDKENISLFCRALGIEEVWKSGYSSGNYSVNVITSLKDETNEKKFYQIIELIFSLDIKNDHDYYAHQTTFSKEILYSKTVQAVEFSNINLEITRKEGEVILYPKGEKVFDEKLVNEVLSFLDKKSGEHFKSALKYYQAGNKKDAIESAESLRRTIEEFLRYKLDNPSGLHDNIKELFLGLKKDNRDPIIRNIIQRFFSYLDEYFNENSKHKDGDIDSNENEFLIYQAGVLLRYIEFAFKK